MYIQINNIEIVTVNSNGIPQELNTNSCKTIATKNSLKAAPKTLDTKKKNAIDILVLKEKLTLRFSEDIDISSQKEQILKKIDTIKKQVLGLNYKLKNKDYVNKAPEEIVLKDKKLIKELTIEEEKLRSIVLSIN